MLIEFPKNIGKSRDKSYPADQKTTSILVPTSMAAERLGLNMHYRHSVFIITNSETTLCAQCPERKSELRVHLIVLPIPILRNKKIMVSNFIVFIRL